jgi:hypothetical protein
MRTRRHLLAPPRSAVSASAVREHQTVRALVFRQRASSVSISDSTSSCSVHVHSWLSTDRAPRRRSSDRQSPTLCLAHRLIANIPDHRLRCRRSSSSGCLRRSPAR